MNKFDETYFLFLLNSSSTLKSIFITEVQRQLYIYKQSPISYYRFGNGKKVLVAFHGYNQTGNDFAYFEEVLADYFTIIAIDFFWHGKSEWREEVTEVQKEQHETYRVYPNPGTNKIFISGETQGRDFVLYDLQGKAVLTSSNQDLTNGMDVLSLNSRMYFYKITDKNTGAIKSGKWLKQ